MHEKNLVTAGAALKAGTRVLIMVHGRGGSAEDILSLATHLNVADFALVAPQATGNSWYPYSFMTAPSKNEPWLSSALGLLKNLVEELNAEGISKEHIYFLGFSQGACLTLEYVARNAGRYGGVIAFTGGLIGDKLYRDHYAGDFNQTPIFIGTANPDPHVPVERVYATTSILKEMNAVVNEKVYPGMGHTISQDELAMANKILSL